MMNLLGTLFASLRAKFTAMWNKLKLLFNPTFWRTKGIATLRGFFTKLFNVKPRDKADYYPMFRWLVSKRLAFAIIIVLGVLGGVFIWMNLPAFSAAEEDAPNLRSYKYNSLALKFYEGNVRILAKDGHVAYIGTVADGEAKGSGSLYTGDGTLLYEGQFDASMYNGEGKLNYPDGTLRYEGSFINNQFSGAGTLYRESGIAEYSGSFSAGQKNGTGTLYNSGGNAIFTGSFMSDQLLYSEMVGKTTSEMAGMYTGQSVVYSAEDEFCVEMSELGAVYSATDGSNTLGEDWMVGSVCVLSDHFPTAERALANINDLSAYFGKPIYFGSTYLNLTEAVAANLLAQSPEGGFGRVEMNTTASFDDAVAVQRYDQNFRVYIYTFERDSLVYTFYCHNSTSGFLMYSIELA